MTTTTATNHDFLQAYTREPTERFIAVVDREGLRNAYSDACGEYGYTVDVEFSGTRDEVRRWVHEMGFGTDYRHLFQEFPISERFHRTLRAEAYDYVCDIRAGHVAPSE